MNTIKIYYQYHFKSERRFFFVYGLSKSAGFMITKDMTSLISLC